MRLPFFNRPPSEPRELSESEIERVATSLNDRLASGLLNLLQTPTGKSGWPYQLDSPHSFWVTTNPKRLPGRKTTVEQLRNWSREWDPLRTVIEYLKAEAASIPITFAPRDKANPAEDQVATMNAFISDTGPLGGALTRRVFEAKMFEDLLVVGAMASWYERGRGGMTIACHHVDAGTIKPRIDSLGWPDPEVPYEQWIIGVKVVDFGPHDLRYDGMFPRTDTPYYDSPVEYALSRILAGIKSDEWNSTWLDGASVHTGATITLPTEWTPEQVVEFTRAWNQMNSNPAMRQNTKFLPSGSTKIGDHSRKDQDFSGFETQTIRRLCGVFGVQPASIGYVGEQYKVTQGESMKASKRVGLGRMLQVRKEFYDDLCIRLGCPDIELVNVDDDPTELEMQTKIGVQACGGPWKKLNEVRAENGLDPVEGGDVIPGAQQQDQEEDDWGDDEPNDEDAPDDDVGRAFNPQQARDQKGRWVRTGKAIALAASLHNYEAAHCKDPYGIGSTVSLVHGNMAGHDYCSVNSRRMATVRIPGKTITAADLKKVVSDNLHLLRNPKFALGTWYNCEDNSVYVDIVDLYKDRAKAHEAGVRLNEIGYYDLKAREFVPTGGDGT